MLPFLYPLSCFVLGIALAQVLLLLPAPLAALAFALLFLACFDLA